MRLLDNYLGVHFEKLCDSSIMKTQPKLLSGLFERCNINENTRRLMTPGISTSSSTNGQPTDPTEYLSLLGSLLYCVISRPDIGFAVANAATKSKNPNVDDFNALIRIVNYLYQTRDKGLIFRKQEKGTDIQIFIHVDASYLLYADSKAQSGYTFSMNNLGTFFAKSSKQSVVTTSSTHAEARALFTAVNEYVFMEMVAKEIGRPFISPAVVLEDNMPVVILLNKDRTLPRASKHFAMLINYCRELIENGTICVKKIATEDNFADILTKHVQGQDFRLKMARMLGITEDSLMS